MVERSWLGREGSNLRIDDQGVYAESWQGGAAVGAIRRLALQEDLIYHPSLSECC
jgi:hypothetical protein